MSLICSLTAQNEVATPLHYRAKSLSFERDGKTITLKPTPIDTDVHTVVAPSVKPEVIPSSVTDNDTPLITDDQQLIAREGVPGSQSPHHYSSIINTILYIVLLVVLLAVHLGYTCAEQIAVSRVGMNANETHMHTTSTSFVVEPYSHTSTLTRLLQSMSYFSNPQTIISIWLCIYPFIHTFTTERTPDHSTIDTSPSSSGHECIQRKAKKARPR